MSVFDVGHADVLISVMHFSFLAVPYVEQDYWRFREFL